MNAINWEKRLRTVLPGHEIGHSTGQELVTLIHDLGSRQQAAQVREPNQEATAAKPPNPKPWGDHTFDGVDVLIVDQNLAGLNDQMLLSGDLVSYLARCYSKCGPIVLMNRKPEVTNPFDLTLRPQLSSWCDLEVGDLQIDNPGLWFDEERWEGFRPWRWPVLPRAIETLDECSRLLEGSKNQRLVDVMAITGVVHLLPPAATEFLTGTKSLEETTVEDFLLRSGQGFRSKDRPFDGDHGARVAAARLIKWTEDIIAVAQQLVIDVPRLAEILPARVPKQLVESLVARRPAPLRLRETNPTVATHYSTLSKWAARDLWWRDALLDDPTLANESYSDPTLLEANKFCEDVSRFGPVEACRGFVANIEATNTRRWIVDSTHEIWKNLTPHPREVQYYPPTRLAM